MLRGLFGRRRLKHERLKEDVEVRFKGELVSERELGYTFVRPGGKSFAHATVRLKVSSCAVANHKHNAAFV